MPREHGEEVELGPGKVKGVAGPKDRPGGVVDDDVRDLSDR